MLDDFARDFYGVGNGSFVIRTHTFDDVVAALGLTLTNTGEIEDVRWNGPAFKAGVSSGATLVAVNRNDYSPAALTGAIVAAEHGGAPIRLLLSYQGGYRTVAVDYHDGLQYPHLVRVNGSPDYLDEIIAAKT